MRKLLILLLICSQSIFSSDTPTADQNNLADSVAKRLREIELVEAIKILKAEEALIRCLVKNAFNPREKDKFPVECKGVVDNFTMLAGYSEKNALLAEFNAAMKELPYRPLNPLSLLFGGTVKAVAGLGVAIATPIVLPYVAGAVVVAAANPGATMSVISMTQKGIGIAGKVIDMVFAETLEEEYARLQKNKQKRGCLKDLIKKG